MKAVGMVRRIDDLGRIVIPKDIRRTLRIREGDPLEMFVAPNGHIVLKKYSPIGEMGDMVQDMADTIALGANGIALICDRDAVVAASGHKGKSPVGRRIGRVVERAMADRRLLMMHYNKDKGSGTMLDNEADLHIVSAAVAPIIFGGEAFGAVVLGTSDEERTVGVLEEKLALIAAGYLARQTE